VFDRPSVPTLGGLCIRSREGADVEYHLVEIYLTRNWLLYRCECEGLLELAT
jgi:hypothetical protein